MSNNSTSQNTSGGFGYLQVSTYLNQLGRAAEGATIRISEPGSEAVLEEVTSDSSGQIQPITLPAPPIQYSMSPTLPRPFNQYNLTVTFKDYSTTTIENVQIFPDSTALQTVVLTPAAQNIVIPYPVLWGNFPPKIPENAIKKMPPPSNFVVLPEPVVPDVITVHAGRPTDQSAKNYTVGFKDYIKNVACSEIYSTWPKETLTANVLVIISFTLNRVYTEWYRNKGFDFTITNSTAFDQAFTYERNIFQEVSDIVDEVFTTYITKPDIRQPLFTQYSDGKKVVRKGWLSQWGSKDLGDQNYTALQILKTYYGPDIILKQAQKVQGVPLSFPGSTLTIGSTGESVKTIQQQLNAIANNYPAIPKVSVDGVFGSSTQEATKKFQEIFKLPITGEVNFPTWYKISDVYVAVEKLS